MKRFDFTFIYIVLFILSFILFSLIGLFTPYKEYSLFMVVFILLSFFCFNLLCGKK